jgi:hypothetical protein
MWVPSTTISFILIVFTNAFDFYVVQNITARKLVKLRFFAKEFDDGEFEFVFECRL